ncbi:MAG: hypothetical protein QW735_04435, partial [archaeon]
MNGHNKYNKIYNWITSPWNVIEYTIINLMEKNNDYIIKGKVKFNTHQNKVNCAIRFHENSLVVDGARANAGYIETINDIDVSLKVSTSKLKSLYQLPILYPYTFPRHILERFLPKSALAINDEVSAILSDLDTNSVANIFPLPNLLLFDNNFRLVNNTPIYITVPNLDLTKFIKDPKDNLYEELSNLISFLALKAIEAKALDIFYQIEINESKNLKSPLKITVSRIYFLSTKAEKTIIENFKATFKDDALKLTIPECEDVYKPIIFKKTIAEKTVETKIDKNEYERLNKDLEQMSSYIGNNIRILKRLEENIIETYFINNSFLNFLYDEENEDVSNIFYNLRTIPTITQEHYMYEYDYFDYKEFDRFQATKLIKVYNTFILFLLLQWIQEIGIDFIESFVNNKLNAL